jgi:riboflavin kinase/FMN adenylyltransferase
MEILHAAQELEPAGRPVCAAIGVFDGVHLGHQRVIRQTLADARPGRGLAVVITFDRHPNAVVAPDRVPPLIYSLPQKLRTIGAWGVDVTWLIPFDDAFSRQSGQAFVRGLARDFGSLHSVCVGAEFTFGHKRSGDVGLLRELGRELGFAVHGMEAVNTDGLAVSSTRIRDAIRAGDTEAASRMLGRPYALAGRVVRGDGLGRQLGFPTANLETHGLVLPPSGVYAVRALVQGRPHAAVLNIGFRPTLGSTVPQLQVEVHLPGFEGDLYGAELEVTFVGKLRDERKFPSLEALNAQIAQDIRAARDRFGA